MPEYIEPSNATQEYLNHTKAMEPCKELPECKSFKLENSPDLDLNYALLKDLAKLFSVGKKCIVVIKHQTCVEIQRLPDGSNAPTFYKHLDSSYKDMSSNVKTTKSEVLRICGSYADLELDKVKKYDPTVDFKAHVDGIITKTFLSRRTGNINCFKSYDGGALVALNDALKQLIEEGKLLIVENKEIYGLKKECYRLPA